MSRGVFLDISKAFDIAWHDGFIYKIKSIAHWDKSYVSQIDNNFLENRFQRVVLNGQTFSWEPVVVRVPQGSVLEPFCSSLFT